jgi:hypothetical protein
MNIRCNAGMTSTNLQGWRGDFPKPVWYNPKGVVNIMSLFVVKKYYRIQYDNYKEQDALRVTKLDGSIMVFTPTAKGLYALRTGSTGWTHVNTVADCKKEYTKREYRDAALARKQGPKHSHVPCNVYLHQDCQYAAYCKFANWPCQHCSG